MTDDIIPPDTRIVIVRRGSNMRVLLPIHRDQLHKIMPYEVALEATRQFLLLQADNPGRADFPITNMEKPLGLTLRGSEYVLDPEVSIGTQLEDRWELQDVPIASPGAPTRQLPCAVLNLDDIND